MPACAESPYIYISEMVLISAEILVLYFYYQSTIKPHK